jgi:hypothetical protein
MLGYGNIKPLSNINDKIVNVHNSHNPAMFTSKTIPGCPGLAGAANNVVAASGNWFKGGSGSKNIKRKIKNITKLYKRMKGGSRKIRSMKRRIRSKMSRTKRYKKNYQKGGYSQYQNNQPITPTYSTGGFLTAKNLGLANPVPFMKTPNCVNCADNYNHFTGKGFASKGH